MPRPIQAKHSHAPTTSLAKADDRPLTHVQRLQTDEVRRGLARRLSDRIPVEEFIAIISGQLQNPLLAQCRPTTLFGAIFESAQLGLRPDPTLQHCFLAPYRNGKLSRAAGRDVFDCKLMLGYRGMIMLATQGSEATVTKVEADVVYASDEFDDVRGMERRIVHRRRRTRSRAERGDPVAVYAVAHLRNADPTCEVLDWWQIDELREQARSDSPWNTFAEEMAKKTAIRRVLRYVPLSPLAARGLDLDERAETGRDQHLEQYAPDSVAADDPSIIDASVETDPPFERIAGVDDVDI